MNKVLDIIKETLTNDEIINTDVLEEVYYSKFQNQMNEELTEEESNEIDKTVYHASNFFDKMKYMNEKQFKQIQEILEFQD
jgi:hypothetical protein